MLKVGKGAFYKAVNYNTDKELEKALVNNKLVIFGVGEYFQEFCQVYPEFAEKILFCIDNYHQEPLHMGSGKIVQVYRPEVVKKLEIREYIIVYCSSYVEQMKQQIDSYLESDYEWFEYPLCATVLEKKIYKRIINPIIKYSSQYTQEQLLKDANCKSKKELVKKYMEKEISIIPRLAIVLTTKCTLKCKDCNELIGFFKEHKDLDKNKIILSMKKILDVVDIVPCYELIGGEPFLADGISDVLSFLITQDKVKRIEITTNGMVVPGSSLIEQLRNEKVVIRVSDYGKLVKQEDAINFFKENNIYVEVLESMMWVVPGGPEKRGRDHKELTYQYDRCYGGMLCKGLWEDKLFGCVRAASLAALGYAEEEQYIKINESDNLKEQINQFLMLSWYEACDHCNIGLKGITCVQPALQL